MTRVLNGLQYLVLAAFAALAVMALKDWLQTRDRRSGYLATAIGLLGVVALITGLARVLPMSSLAASILNVEVVAFLAPGYAMLAFRSTFIPLQPAWKAAAITANVLVGVLAIAILPQGPGASPPTFLQSPATLALVLVWSACVGEPIVRF